ncbi:MBL fold metallo-hydrolase [Phanerochaete sordida]|uniref:MBL fold metallo-hydrolase n=1 Tax=Phanerochaete sordida TaxID=48140 RepID=A0A9P3LA20_9APHY|nr:MBL fold metallo-hydrolase [Phanerochaete sordida]
MSSLATHTPDSPIEFICLGSGTSSLVPHVDCLTAPPEATPCKTCLSTLHPEGKKNIRRNTSAALRLRDKHGEQRTIIIDVGKSFQASAIEWFPKYGLRRIDAVLITHAHADAMNGLDDLRGWTLRSAIQSHVDLYVTMHTFQEVQRAFPYLVSKEFASGGGDVPEFKWHIIEDRVPFEIENTGIKIAPFAVHHGRIFSTLPAREFYPTPTSLSPASTNPSTPPQQPSTPLPIEEPVELTTSIRPYLCLGFVIQDSVVYLSDVSHIPEDVWAMFGRGQAGDRSQAVPPVFVLDCLRLQPHTSHLGIAEAITVARRMGAARTYLTGFGHEVSHEEYVSVCEAVGGKAPADAQLTPTVREALDLVPPGETLWVRPAYDGLRVFVSGEKTVRDEAYD